MTMECVRLVAVCVVRQLRKLSAMTGRLSLATASAATTIETTKTTPWRRFAYTIASLTYNSVSDVDYALDTLLNPLLAPLDHVAAWAGPRLVTLVAALLAAVICICYTLGTHWYLSRERYATLTVAYGIGHLLQLNVWWHFYKGVTVSPGHPEVMPSAQENSSVCRRCMMARPARAHHCSVCRRCVLRMDHHCPWLNNCVGLHTHRHFYLFAVHTLAGCVFIAVFGLPVLYDHWFTATTDGPAAAALGGRLSRRIYSRLVWFTFFVVAGVGLCALGIVGWHGRLLARNETSVERLANEAQRQRFASMGLVYRNPYDRGSATANLAEVLLLSTACDGGLGGCTTPRRASWWALVIPWLTDDADSQRKNT